jgi:hypothetical protein
MQKMCVRYLSDLVGEVKRRGEQESHGLQMK